MIQLTIAAFAIALCLGFLTIPLMKRFALRINLMDQPDQKRKLHKKSLPLIGGISVFLVTIASLLILGGVADIPLKLNADSQMLIGLLLASTIIVVLGMVDDRFCIRGRQKLLGQIVAALVLIYFGYRFDSISIYGRTLDLQVFSYGVVAFWILLGINSVNLLDGADGFATTIGIIVSLALCVIAFSLGKYGDAMLCAAVCGGLVAFMWFNFPPASAYLGDAGSMLIGLFISAMAIKTSSKEAATYVFLAPIALLAIPMFDTLAAIVRRKMTGRSIYTVDRGHLHHALIGKGFGPRKSLMMFIAMCLMTATGGTMSAIYREAEYAFLSIVAVGVFLIVGRVFGFAEYKLISTRSKSIIRSFFVMPAVKGENGHHNSVQLQGDRNWEGCWSLLREFAENNKLLRLTLDLNLPWIHESFHATYKGSDRQGAKGDEKWKFETPLVVKERMIGRVEMDAMVMDVNFKEVILELGNILAIMDDFFIETIGDSIKAAPEENITEDLDVAAQRQSLEFGAIDPAGPEDGRKTTNN